MVSLNTKFDLIKAEFDSLRPGLQQFLERMADAPEASQSLLAPSQVIYFTEEAGKAPETNPFVSLEFEGITRSITLTPSTEYKMKGTDCPRTRVRLLLEELHSIAELRNMTVSGKRMIKQPDGKTVCMSGLGIPALTKAYLYQMEADRRKLDTSKSEFMRPLQLEVNGYLSKILESYKSGRDGDGAVIRKGVKRGSNDLDSQDSQEFVPLDPNKKIRL